MNTSNNTLKGLLAEKFKALKDFITEHLKIVLPVAVAVIAVIIFIIAMAAHSRKIKAEEAAAAEAAAQEAAAESETEVASIEIPEVALEKNAYPEVNELINKYYKAMADGDTDTLRSINSSIDDTEAIRIQETAEYIDSYQSIDVYTKTGPTDGTYLAYVTSNVKFKDYDAEVPGMQAYYICTDDSGNLYINDGEETDTVTNYIREVSLQDDVVDLNNEIAVEYNDMLAADEDLSVFLTDLTSSIDTAVGEALASAESDTETETEEETTDEDTQTAVAGDTVTTVRATTTVNVRSSDSETADKVGQAAEGDEFTLIEEKGNGWSEIDFNGENAFIKSEYLETASTQTVVTVAEDDTEDTDTETADADTDTTAGTGDTVTVKENVRIRASASEDAEKLGTAYMGEKLELIQKQANGWTKIKYNGQTAYVKSDYVE